ncbi:MAG: hypothetical protein LBK45_00705 [Tannerellaceae bacterium]|jgi:uncharacterized coiled-coil DUF342 family protein|nr:hypothetical protein [Tannerellaceae bacterium]
MNVLESNEKNAPCQYAAEELKERALLAIEEMKQGKGVAHEDMKNRYDFSYMGLPAGS